uniref:Uncharacterized protein n=1 Tax=viral metagenome TaxID=1070528 RepID=A0A6M3J208_9ZZZZ
MTLSETEGIYYILNGRREYMPPINPPKWDSGQIPPVNERDIANHTELSYGDRQTLLSRFAGLEAQLTKSLHDIEQLKVTTRALEAKINKLEQIKIRRQRDQF